jgi:hypothetical protein
MSHKLSKPPNPAQELENPYTRKNYYSNVAAAATAEQDRLAAEAVEQGRLAGATAEHCSVASENNACSATVVVPGSKGTSTLAAPAAAPAAGVLNLLVQYLRRLAEMSRKVEDAITGRAISTVDSVVNLSTMAESEGGSEAATIQSCAELLAFIMRIDLPSTMARVAILSKAGTGKSWMMTQLQWICSQGPTHVFLPCFVKIEQLAKLLSLQCSAPAHETFLANAKKQLTLDWLVQTVTDNEDPGLLPLFQHHKAGSSLLFCF